MPNAEIMAKLTEVVGEQDAQAFLQFAKDIEAHSIEECTILDFKGDYTEKQKRTDVH